MRGLKGTEAREEEGPCRCRYGCLRLRKIRVHPRSPFQNRICGGGNGGRRGGPDLNLSLGAATRCSLYRDSIFFGCGRVMMGRPTLFPKMGWAQVQLPLPE